MSTPRIPGVDRDALADTIMRGTVRNGWTPARAADAALAHIAAHHKCACDREHDDEWVEVDEDVWDGLPDGVRLRQEWVRGDLGNTHRQFIRRDDLPEDPRALIARELGAARADTFLGLLDEHGWTVTRKGER